MTDEELKQQYGIHLTSRIQEDGDGKEAKWADIDDDEDDWAPETIEWNDGTKSTLTPAEIAPPPTRKPVLSANTDINDASKPAQPPKILPPQFTSSVGPNATVLKLGANAERQQAQKAAILLSRSPSEKSGLMTSKANHAPAPTKSPWATLPPVDKVSPIAINPQLSMPPPNRLPQSGVHSQSPSALTAPSPAKEISADDFNRSWRESSPSQTRELYMPSSGKYEAVPESRRRMSRNDQNFRAAAVLQRPSHGDVHAPAEPSAAFQTNRTSMDSARRRASSTISGGSGQFGRRMSIKSSEHATPVFDTHKMAIEVDTAPFSADGTMSHSQTPTYQARGTNDYISAAPGAVTEGQIEAQRTQQKALMKENVERARKRKIEEEQRMEAEKQIRIRAKLASLGPSTTTGKADEQPHDNALKMTPEQALNTANPLTTTQSPPKPPQPLASGEPQQYGMMKVFPLDSVKKLGTSLPRPVESHKTMPPARVESKEPPEANRDPAHILNGVRTMPEPRHPSNPDVVSPPEPSPKFPKHTSGSDARSGWNDLRHDHRGPQTSNLWGVPNLNNKALGNGTFDQTLAGYAPQDLSRTSSTAQGWMNGRTPHAGRSPQTQHVNVNHALPDTRSYSFQSITSPDQGPLAVDSEIDSLFPTTKPAPIGPPQSQHTQPPPMNGFQNGSRPTGLEAWGNFHAVASQQERVENEKIQREIAARREEELRTGVRQGPQYTFNETWKQVQVGDHAGQRQLANVSQTTVAPSIVFGAVGSLSNTDTLPRIGGSQAGRGSRFFPQQPGNQLPQDRRAFTYSHPEPPRSPSPPPAEEYASFHPVFDGDFARPVVHFPREKAVVKLPPARLPSPPSSIQVQPEAAPQPESNTPMTWAARVSMPPPAPSTTAPTRSVSTPIVQNPSWQERFNGLLGRKSSPAKEQARLAGPALAVASSTKEPLDVQHVSIPAASVSLPIQIHVQADITVEDELVITKDVESEDDLFEDREPGSLPAINLPRDALLPPHWAPTTTSRIAPVPVEPTSTGAFMVSNLFERHNGPQKSQFAIIRMPGSLRSIKKDLPVKSGTFPNQGTRQRFGSGPPSSSGSYSNSSRNPRHRTNPRSRQTFKAH